MSAPPQHILIIGSGVFGLSTAYALATRPEFDADNKNKNKTRITVLDRHSFPAPDAASVDSSRIIRPDYADPNYLALMTEAHAHWRADFGADGRYTESGLCIVTSVDSSDSDYSSGGGGGGNGEYMAKAVENVRSQLQLRVGRRDEGGQLELLDSPGDVDRVMEGMDGRYGSRGYVNWTSGWADAEAGLRYMRSLVAKTGRVEFRDDARVQRVMYNEAAGSAKGVLLEGGEEIEADLVVVAAGAWTPALVDLRGVASATGQVLAYVDLTPEEETRLSGDPTLICETSGMFIITPSKGVLKVARHGYGYANPMTIPHPERDDGTTINVSLPRTHTTDPGMQVPREGLEVCREFLKKTHPSMADRPWTHARLCWYTDTPTGNWLVSYHPRYRNVFVATGGSGHAYKFLPTIGQRIVDVILRQDRDDLGGRLRTAWQWPTQRLDEDHVWTRDWRGGPQEMVLDEELAK